MFQPFSCSACPADNTAKAVPLGGTSRPADRGSRCRPCHLGAGEPAVTSPCNRPGRRPENARCTAFDTVSKAVKLQTNADLGPDPVALEAVAGNARLALLGGGQYLLNRLDSATPPELADAVRSFANNLQDIGMYAAAGVMNSDPAQAARLAEGEATRKQILDLCK